MGYNKVAVFGVIYSGIEIYIDDYFNSLVNQTYTDFDIWIYNDGFDKKILERTITKYSKLNIFVKKIDNNTPAQIREIAILDLQNKYDYLIFTDADDFFSKNRIEKSIKTLLSYDFCYNDMILVDSRGGNINQDPYFKNRNNPLEVNDYIQLLDKNFCGLSNTAINLKTIDLSFLKVPPNIIAADWWIFSLLLIKGYVGCFLKDAYTYYRQHETNTVGGLSKLSKQQLIRGFQIKMDQYELLLEYYPSKFDFLIKKEFDDIKKLEKIINESNIYERYLTHVNIEGKEFMWWENIKFEERWISE